eukprot:gb/GECG01013285.1/.p1 GENE.gb/GECG01013285.1/~~gb/GECG01013285.1/.p1  ORF type:complete len:376 (+),score=21.05 gb/GECG01013285.1/:1-1128(+)
MVYFSQRCLRVCQFGAIVVSFIAGSMVGFSAQLLNAFQTNPSGCSDCNERPPSATLRTNGDNAARKNVWDVLPLEHTEHVEFIPGATTDAFTPFHNYLYRLSKNMQTAGNVTYFPELPGFDTWIHYLEGYHNHFYRFRGSDLVFMEVGVQSGGKIPLLRDYFGPGFTYVGIDINPATKVFESEPWVNIEIGDASDPTFLARIRQKYPHVDIFLDDGGHTMREQMTAIREMLPHVHSEGVYVCEDLGTSWSRKHGGIPRRDVRNQEFLEKTAFGLVHKTLDWFMFAWIRQGGRKYSDLPNDFFSESWWRTIPQQVKHIHLYNQFIVYEKGITHKPRDVQTVGRWIPLFSKTVRGKRAHWNRIVKRVSAFTNSPWRW